MRFLYPCRIFLLLIAIAASTNETKSQNFHLVKDFNTTTNAQPSNFDSRILTSQPQGNLFALLNGVSYFGADGGVHGRGLWRTDGTEAGTYQVKEGVNPTDITVVKGKLYFAGTGDPGLWTSDGTEAGTTPVLSQRPPGVANFIPGGLTNFNGSLYFLITGSAYYNQLWKTDGTSAGTLLIKDFYSTDPGLSVSALVDLVVIKNRLYFNAFSNSPTLKWVLCVSDGSASGTFVLSHKLNNPAQLIAASSDNNDSLVYFSAASPDNSGRILYVTNGDEGNATITTGFNGIISDNFYGQNLVKKNDVIYFVGRPNNSAKEESLYKFDINGVNGVQPVKVVTGTSASGGTSGISGLTDIDGALYFSLYDAVNNKTGLWKSDGSSRGNVLLKDSLQPGGFLKGTGFVYFNGFESVHGTELWKTDGTANGTVMVKDIHPGGISSYPSRLNRLGDKILFSADDGVHGSELWLSDGSFSSTMLLKDINQTATSGSSPNGITPFENTIVFSASSGRESRLWKSDGTAINTKIINDTISSYSLFNRSTHVVRKNKIHFFGSSASGRPGIYKTDVITGATDLLKDFTGFFMHPSQIIETDSLVYFLLFNGSNNGYELWRTDGSAANTFLIKKDSTYYLNAFASAGNTLFYASQGSNALWKTDGTIEGTAVVKSFIYDPYIFSVSNGTLFFAANADGNTVLWKTDGTSAGTVKVTDDLDSPNSLTPFNGKLLFTAFDISGIYGNVGRALFKTDGTKNGTALVKDIHSGSEGTTIYKSIGLNGILYLFTNSTSTGSVELWRTDGTSDGTQLISAVGVKGGYVTPTEIVTCKGRLFFVVGNTLWESDGTQKGTHPVEDKLFSTITIQGYNNHLTATDNQLFFSASSYLHGHEVYVGTVGKAGVVSYVTIADGNWNSPDTWVDNMVPPEGASVIIKHNITGNMNTTCNGVLVEPAGRLTVNAGVTITILQ